jgi:pilus assembly protein Flp/PilA
MDAFLILPAGQPSGIRYRGSTRAADETDDNRSYEMFGLMKKFRQLMQKDRRGVTALEYGLLAAVIGGVIITAATTFGNSLTSAYGSLGTTLTTEVSSM